MLAQVIVDIVHENVAHTFTYTVPPGMKVSLGQRVEVPFGPRSKEGIIVSFSEVSDLPPERLRPIRRTLEDYPAVLPHLLELAEWMAETAHCPLAETLRLMLPAEMRGGRVQVKTQPTARSLGRPRSVRGRVGGAGPLGKAPCAADASQGWSAAHRCRAEASCPRPAGKSAPPCRAGPASRWVRKRCCAVPAATPPRSPPPIPP